jgi:hypothetical protein
VGLFREASALEANPLRKLNDNPHTTHRWL